MEHLTSSYNLPLEYPKITVGIICIIILAIIIYLYKNTSFSLPGRETFDNMEAEMARLVSSILAKQKKNLS